MKQVTHPHNQVIPSMEAGTVLSEVNVLMEKVVASQLLKL